MKSIHNTCFIGVKTTREYYSKISEQTAQNFDRELINSINYLKENSNYFQKRYRNVKIVFTNKFPFRVHYIVENNSIFIQRILQPKRVYN